MSSRIWEISAARTWATFSGQLQLAFLASIIPDKFLPRETGAFVAIVVTGDVITSHDALDN